MAKEGEIGALWMSDKGFMTGVVNGVKVIAFKNDRKQPGEKTPDWRILKARINPIEPLTPQHEDLIQDNDIPF